MKISHAGFTIGFPALLYVACNLINLDKLTRWFRDGDGVDVLALSSYLLAGACAFVAVFALLAHRHTIKLAAVLITLLSAIATYFIAKYDVAIDSSMLRNALHTDTVEVTQLLSLQMAPYIGLALVACALIILKVEIRFRESFRYLWTSAAIVGSTLAVALTLLYVNFPAIHRAGNVSNKYIVYSLVPVNVIASSISVASDTVKRFVRTHRKEPEITAAVATPGDLVVVLAIGEASRRKSFSLYGYQRRNTNPSLQKISGLQLLDGVAAKGSTLYALPEILEKDDIKLTTLVSRSGVPTSCYVNYTLYDNCSAVGEVPVENCGHGGKCYDEDVIPLLAADVGQYASGYRFIVLHLGGGSHGPTFGKRHPPEFLKFQPTCDDADVVNRCTPDQLYNSYDNTILYVDHVLSEIIRTLDQSGAPYVFIYLSDHGESLLEDGFLFHGTPPGIPLPDVQAQIPLIVKSSVPVTVVPRTEYRQPEVFDTVLDLFSIHSPDFDRSGSFLKKNIASTPTEMARNLPAAAPTR
jgi:lipid A ethanolaminephosphotransferase